MAGKLNPRQISSFTNNKAVVELIIPSKEAVDAFRRKPFQLQKREG